MCATTAGKGDPYWYEWTVGLLRVVELLDPDTQIESVTFQATGIKGWDDVVVQFADGVRHMIQVKHSRVEDSLTFGDLVGRDKEGASLLGDLAKAWVDLGPKPAGSRCILFTNRSAGERESRSDAKTLRPALLKFHSWLQKELVAGKSLDSCQPELEWRDAWQEFRAALNTVSVTDQEQFLRSLDLQANQDDLEELAEQVQIRLATLLQVPVPRVQGLSHALDHALRSWTTRKEKVTVEDLREALALDESEKLDRHSPAPPAPFFPSRVKDVQTLQQLLIADKPVIFLSAPPGAGKTSVISELANRRTAGEFEGTIALRYFAFRPLSPDAPLVPLDSDQRVQASSLWYDLLSQLRRGLSRRLSRYRVPVRNEFLSWAEARTHVLRIADMIGREMGRPFVIAIDGIDHAARAERQNPASAREFFQSLPDPGALKKLSAWRRPVDSPNDAGI